MCVVTFGIIDSKHLDRIQPEATSYCSSCVVVDRLGDVACAIARLS